MSRHAANVEKPGKKPCQRVFSWDTCASLAVVIIPCIVICFAPRRLEIAWGSSECGLFFMYQLSLSVQIMTVGILMLLGGRMLRSWSRRCARFIIVFALSIIGGGVVMAMKQLAWAFRPSPIPLVTEVTLVYGPWPEALRTVGQVSAIVGWGTLVLAGTLLRLSAGSSTSTNGDTASTRVPDPSE